MKFCAFTFWAWGPFLYYVSTFFGIFLTQPATRPPYISINIIQTVSKNAIILTLPIKSLCWRNIGMVPWAAEKKSKQLLSPHAAELDTVQDFLIKLGIKPRLHILKISIFSLNHVIVRPKKIFDKEINFYKLIFLKTLIFKVVLCFLKMCPIFVGSVHNFSRPDGDII